MTRVGAIVGGRATYEAAEHRGDQNPFGMPFFMFAKSLDLEHLGIRQSALATLIEYRVKR
jgi:hypothetical protein